MLDHSLRSSLPVFHSLPDLSNQHSHEIIILILSHSESLRRKVNGVFRTIQCRYNKRQQNYLIRTTYRIRSKTYGGQKVSTFTKLILILYSAPATNSSRKAGPADDSNDSISTTSNLNSS